MPVLLLRADATTTGMFVVESVVPGSPADGVLEPGDVLVRVGGAVVTHFLHLEEILNASVGGQVELMLERGGKQVRGTSYIRLQRRLHGKVQRGVAL